MQSMVSVIQNHSTNLFKDPTAPTARKCNFRQMSNCPLYEKCIRECLVSHAQVDRFDINHIKSCYGTCEKSFKEHYNNHTASFRNKNEEKSTESSKYIWELKNNNKL